MKSTATRSATKKAAGTSPKHTAKTTSGSSGAARKSSRKWSAGVTATSNALDLQSKVFRSKDPHKIAASLKRSAEKSKRKKGTPLQSAMSMLNFYINRAGKNLSAKEKQPLEKAKEVLRGLFEKNK